MSLNLTPVLASRKMSDSLRERLKRSSRYYSPQVLKQDSVEDEAVIDTDQPLLNLDIPHQSQSAMDENVCTHSKNEDSSQDFEYSDEVDGKIESSVRQTPPPMKKLCLDSEEIPSKRCATQIGPKEKLAVPKFERKMGLKRLPFQAYVAQTNEDTAKDYEQELENREMKVEEISRVKVPLPVFKRTPVTGYTTSRDLTNRKVLARTVCEPHDTSASSAVKNDHTKTKTDITVKQDDSDTDTYTQENTETFTSEQLEDMSPTELHSLRQTLHDKMEQKGETLRKLKMVKMYRSKNNLAELTQLIRKWRSVCHEALGELLDLLSTGEHNTMHTASVYHLARFFNLDLPLLHIQPDEGSQEDQG